MAGESEIVIGVAAHTSVQPKSAIITRSVAYGAEYFPPTGSVGRTTARRVA
jgi:hypothetical protein